MPSTTLTSRADLTDRTGDHDRTAAPAITSNSTASPSSSRLASRTFSRLLMGHGRCQETQDRRNDALNTTRATPPHPDAAEGEESVTEAWNMRLVGHTHLDGEGDCMHVNLKDGYAYVGHMGERGTSILDVRDPTAPRLVTRIPSFPNTHGHKVQIVDDVLLVNRERIPRSTGPWVAGMAIYDIGSPTKPREIAFWPAGGKGVHRPTFWEMPYAYVSAGADGYSDQFLTILDLSDPASPDEVGRWWLPGMRTGAGEPTGWGDDWVVKFHHAIVRGDRAYCSWWDQGVVILDVSDKGAPRFVSQLTWEHDVSRATHTAFPLPARDLLVVTEERIPAGCVGVAPNTRIVDISDELNPKVVSTFPVPEGDFCNRGGRFGPHNVHEMRPGTMSDPNTVYLTYFNAGIRVYDVSDPLQPKEIAYYIPDPPPGQPSIQLNDVLVGPDGLVYVTDRMAGGLYILELEASRPLAAST